MIITPKSHVDHDITAAQMLWILTQTAGRSGFFIETLTLPETLGTVPCTLYGPIMGDAPVPQSECVSRVRGERPYPSRCTIRPARPVHTVTVIAGPTATDPCVLYTAFGGPLAPKEALDPTLTDKDRDASITFWFWDGHALAVTE